ncbi:hypothetical protein, partial [Lactiplantibacillus garii]|uniref:hypothetical protein n=1 Tax=Lactiplantibacillus garii TaxID=2306423 RepID=UPI001CDCA5F1
LAFITNDVFFTWKSLIDAGFKSDFVKRTKFDDYAYIRLIFTIPSIRTIQTNGSVFINQSQPTPKCPPLVAFLAQELGDVSRDIDEFIAELNHKFDLDLDRTKILEKVNKSDLACSLETNCIYPSQTRMYDEVYQGISI